MEVVPGIDKSKTYEFLFMAFPCKIRGATASMIRPPAIV